jgi:hypothetical protein
LGTEQKKKKSWRLAFLLQPRKEIG